MFPMSNTLIVDPATLFGLAQLYQLRGRVGRFDREAYAYFLYPPQQLERPERGWKLFLSSVPPVQA